MKVVNVHDYGGIGPAEKAGVQYCGRPTVLGNPYSHKLVPGTIKVATRELAVECYRKWLWRKIQAGDQEVLGALRLLDDASLLGCWCAPQACHCEILIKAWNWLKQEGRL